MSPELTQSPMESFLFTLIESKTNGEDSSASFQEEEGESSSTRQQRPRTRRLSAPPDVVMDNAESTITFSSLDKARSLKKQAHFSVFGGRSIASSTLNQQPCRGSLLQQLGTTSSSLSRLPPKTSSETKRDARWSTGCHPFDKIALSERDLAKLHE